MLTADFDYTLPKRLIAQEPCSPRDACRLMVLERSTRQIRHETFFHIGQFLRKGDVLVMNRSRVIPARLKLEYKGKIVEIFLTRRLNEKDWSALVYPSKLLQPGVKLEVAKSVEAEIVEVQPDGQRVVRFSVAGAEQKQLLEAVGQVPYPPYIQHTAATFEDYQTVFSQEEGSVAAPTAGLHFTQRLLRQLAHQGVQLETVVLHVGLGTFLPIKGRQIEDHTMHSELYSLDFATAQRLQQAKDEGRRIIAVGTTAVRTLEASYIQGRFIWGRRETALYIRPGYKWQCVDGLLTNFHLPKSSLLVLVRTFGDANMDAKSSLVLKAYNEAIQQRYRFYSFGDAMLIV